MDNLLKALEEQRAQVSSIKRDLEGIHVNLETITKCLQDFINSLNKKI